MCVPLVACGPIYTVVFQVFRSVTMATCTNWDEIRAAAMALRESLSICLLTPPFSRCMEEAAREAAHKQQRWLTFAPSPRTDHHHAELTVPPITAESDWDEEDDVGKSEIVFCVLV